MKLRSVSMGLSFIDLLCGALISVVILYLISPMKTGNTDIQHDLTIVFTCADPDADLMVGISIAGKRYHSQDHNTRNVVKWYVSDVTKKINAKVKVNGRPTISGYFMIVDHTLPFSNTECVAEPSLGYSGVNKKLSLDRVFFEKFTLKAE